MHRQGAERDALSEILMNWVRLNVKYQRLSVTKGEKKQKLFEQRRAITLTEFVFDFHKRYEVTERFLPAEQRTTPTAPRQFQSLFCHDVPLGGVASTRRRT
jgi:hypothetical protein